MKKVFIFFVLGLHLQGAVSQTTVSSNIVIVTFDGMRWQEVFGGADSLLVFDTTATYSYQYAKNKFWAPTANERREKLMPFFWSELRSKGLLLGNRQLGSHVNNANSYWFSYPGYNEIFTGFPDPKVNSNDKVYNSNITVLEYLNSLAEYKGKVAAFCSWGVFSYILNDKRSGVYVNDGFKNADDKISERMKLMTSLQHDAPDLFHGGERLDMFTFEMGMEYMKKKKPRVMYFGFGDTDEFAHAGMYDMYLDAARKTDNWIKQIWNYIQATPSYANKTTLIITTDHGRGGAAGGKWKHHGSDIQGADEIWLAAIGPAVQDTGEMKGGENIKQGQIAATIARILGKNYSPKHPVLAPIDLIIPR